MLSGVNVNDRSPKDGIVSQCLAKRYPHFQSPDEDFSREVQQMPNDTAKRLLFNKVYSSCNLGNLGRTQELRVTNNSKFIETSRDFKYTTTLKYRELDTEKMICDSCRLYAVPYKPKTKAYDTRYWSSYYWNATYFSRLIRPHKMDSILRENFPTLGNPDLDLTWKLTTRKSGLKDALRYHLAIMKNHEPEMYDFCLDAASKLNRTCPMTDPPEAILPICVHQDEPMPAMFLLHFLKEQKNIDHKSLHLYFFVNGNDPEKINETALRMSRFIDAIWNKPDQGPVPQISIITAPINAWRFGLKAIPLNIAIMQLMLSGVLDKYDADIPAIFLDADLRKVHPNLVRARIDSIHNGHVITGGKYAPGDIAPKEYSQHINLELLKMIYFAFNTIHLSKKELWQLKPGLVESKSDLPIDEFSCWGANSCASLMALAYTGGIKPYAVYEEAQWQKPISTLFGHAFGINKLTDGYKYGLFDDRMEEHVLSDGGELARVLEQGLKPDNLYRTHDKAVVGNQVKVNFNNPKLNLKRLQEDIDFFVDKKIYELIRGIQIPKQKRKKLVNLFLKKFELAIVQLKNMENVLDQYGKELDLVQAMVRDSFARYTKVRIRIH